ncbi:long-chain-acyl-CoA synthetase [Salinisphaera dokdonensis CL-ES53]|uniref:Long-chain-acyl-CoA synthetase n=1 Tax=Salinisphaera dokdonensis CL-ES53 TaxID=1304272 RepID=A0ABV2AYG0_9GAMM
MSEYERDTLSVWDVLKPTPEKLAGVDRLLMGAGILLKSRLKDNLTIATLIENHAGRRPQHDALTFENQRYTYAQLNAHANRYARTLKAGGIGKGDVVGVLLDNRPETLIIVAAMAKLGAAAAMCNTKQRGEVLAHSLATVKPKAMLVGEELFDAYAEIREEPAIAELAPVWFVGHSAVGAAPDGCAHFLEQVADQPSGNLDDAHRVSSTDTCFYIFTSGTTGMPKASRMSHLRWLRGGAGLGMAGLRLTPNDRFYCPLPLYHNNALTVSWSSVLCAGATFALAPKFSVSNFWPDVRHHKATVFCYIGELCRYLLQAEPNEHDRNHAIRAVIGNGLRPDIWDEFKDRFGIQRICEFYGASEGNLVFVNGFNMDRTAGFCPLPFAVVEYDPETEEPVTGGDGRMKEVAKGETGLLLNKVTDFAPFEGYTDAEASEKKLCHGVFKKDDCYFNTGDLVRRQGMRHIAFVDRLGDTFRWKGENVATTQVENALNAHPEIEESVVYGVEVPHSDGRAGMAAITPVNKLADIDWAGLVAHLRNELPAYAVPVFIRLRPEQEITGTMKYRKVDLKKQGYSPEGNEPVFMLASRGERYEPIDDDTRAALTDGDISL